MLEELERIIRRRDSGEITSKEANQLKYELAKRDEVDGYIRTTISDDTGDECGT